MANNFIDTFQNLANSFSSATNGFTWDSAIRKFQYAIAGITLGALAIFETTNKMQCSVASQSFPEYYFASSYCFETTWYHVVDDANSTKIKYDDSLRYFKWYILIPPLITIILSVLYGAVVNGFLVQSIRTASKIMDMLNVKAQDNIVSPGTSHINQTIRNMAIRSRVFSETNLHYRKNNSWCSCFGGKGRSKKCSPTYAATEDANDQVELVSVSVVNGNEVKFVGSTGTRLGENTYLYYHVYIFLCLVINGVAVGFINPHFFWFPNVIACHYRKEDLSFHWSICSVPGYRYFRVAVIIVMLNHAVGVLVALLSLLYVNVFVPREISNASAAITAYTRDPKQQEKLLQCWNKYGKEKINGLTATTRFLLSLIYQNIDRTLCFRLVLALVDIEKDREAIEMDLPRLTGDIVHIDLQQPGTANEEKEEKINEIRTTIMNPVGIEQAKPNIQHLLMTLVTSFLTSDKNNLIRHQWLFQAQQVHRITGVQLPQLPKETKEQFVASLRERKVTDFESAVVYSKFLSAVYDLSKVKEFFTLLQPMEIGHLIGAETSDHISDNGHEVVAGQQYDGRKAFDTSGYCWRSSDATAYNWIRRSWDDVQTIQLIAIQGSHVNRQSTPVRFNFTAKLEESGDEKNVGDWVAVSETYQSFDWLNDEWRVFPVLVVSNGVVSHPRTKCIQINIFENAGAEYFEIQKIKIYSWF